MSSLLALVAFLCLGGAIVLWVLRWGQRRDVRAVVARAPGLAADVNRLVDEAAPSAVSRAAIARRVADGAPQLRHLFPAEPAPEVWQHPDVASASPLDRTPLALREQEWFAALAADLPELSSLSASWPSRSEETS